jgi:hypothetical protein
MGRGRVGILRRQRPRSSQSHVLVLVAGGKSLVLVCSGLLDESIATRVPKRREQMRGMLSRRVAQGNDG